MHANGAIVSSLSEDVGGGDSGASMWMQRRGDVRVAMAKVVLVPLSQEDGSCGCFESDSFPLSSKSFGWHVVVDVVVDVNVAGVVVLSSVELMVASSLIDNVFEAALPDAWTREIRDRCINARIESRVRFFIIVVVIIMH